MSGAGSPDELPGLPWDAEDGPVFRAPWEATAFAMAGATGVIAGSPIPFAPNGPTPLRDSSRMHSTFGMSIAVGIRYSLNDGVTSRPSS